LLRLEQIERELHGSPASQMAIDFSQELSIQKRTVLLPRRTRDAE